MSLSNSEIQSAVKYNLAASRRIGWAEQFGRVAAALGPTTATLTAEQFATTLSGWQADQRGLSDDGKLGPGSWKRIKKLHSATAVGSALPEWLKPKDASTIEVLTVGGTGPTWMHVAAAELRYWDTEIGKMSTDEAAIPELAMSRDEAYFLSSPYFGAETQPRGTKPKNSKRRHWCAAFVNHCLHRAGYSHTGSAGAHSFNGRHRWYFDGCEEPERGCVIVVSNGTTGSHVAFLDSADGTPDTLKMDKSRRVKISRHAVKLFGGNQRGERINSRVTNYNYMLTQVGRNGVRSPYMKPRRGPSNCNLDPVTAFPHHCGKTHLV